MPSTMIKHEEYIVRKLIYDVIDDYTLLALRHRDIGSTSCDDTRFRESPGSLVYMLSELARAGVPLCDSSYIIKRRR
jgi:hypothetical protein